MAHYYSNYDSIVLFSRYRASFLLFNLRSMFHGCFGGFLKSLSEVLTRKCRTFHKCVCIHLSAHGPSLCCANLKLYFAIGI